MSSSHATFVKENRLVLGGAIVESVRDARVKTRATIEEHRFLSEVPQFGRLRHVLMMIPPTTDDGEK